MAEPANLADENKNDCDKQSIENFQKCIFELFEKNGVINDLRAYLRGHIVNVLKTSDSGGVLVCKKNFTQRLELTFQAINILIAEYLLRLEFSYSLSVFVSEIPLANMVFSFAHMLMENNDHSELRFTDADVFSILKYIGIKCDSVHATQILDMYKKNEKTPLLLCILKCLPLYGKEDDEKEIVVSSSQSIISSNSSEDQLNQYKDECTHHIVCESCRNRDAKLKQKYKRKKKSSVAVKNIDDTRANSSNMDMFLKNVSSMERGLIDELFQQLKSVYESEMEMIKQNEEKRVQRSLAVHLLKLKQKRDQLESSYKAREAELQIALQEKKRFLWGLARTLREQHQHMTRAMAEVKAETERLATKEDSLRAQLLEAETILRKRGAKMRKQISSELSALENHLETMKRERDSINLERQQLQKIKLTNSTLKPLLDSEDLKSHYELLKDELNVLKDYIQSAKTDPKCVTEKSTMTELSGMIDKFEVVLNNGKEVELKTDKPRRLINDLKKFKNVNQLSIEDQSHKIVDERSPGRSSTSSEAGDAKEVETSQYFTLQDENKRLREFARQQREHIDSLSWQQAKLQAQLSSKINSITPVRVIATCSRPVTLQNTTLTQQNATFAPRNTTFTQGNILSPGNPTFLPGNATFDQGNVTFTPGNATFTPGNATLTPGNTTFTPGNTVLNTQIGPLTSQNSSSVPQTSFIQNRNIPNPFIFQSGSLPQSAPPVSQGIGSQLLPPRLQPVANQGVLFPRPRTAPLSERDGAMAQRLHPTASVNNVSVGWRIGAGEELSVFSGAGPRVLVPGDEIPFVGVIGTRHTDNRRYLINQWRSLRRRISPHSGILKRSASPSRNKQSHTRQVTATADEAPNVQPSCSKNDHVQSSDQIKPSSIKREKSPNSVLRDAKLRLKKLEIEAEAVEKSYLDFRKKRDTMNQDFKDNALKNIDIKQNKSTDKLKETNTDALNILDLDEYLKEINTKLDLSIYNSKVTTANKVSPVPNEYSEKQDAKDYLDNDYFDKKDYLETPLTEFRKYYNSGKRYEVDSKLFEKIESKSPKIENTDMKSSISNESPQKSSIRSIKSPEKLKSPKSTRKNIIRQAKNDKEKELEILRENIGKIYNMSEHSIVEMSKSTDEIDNKVETLEEIVNENKIITNIENIEPEIVENSTQEIVADKNLLMVEVENTPENNVNLESKTQDFTLVIESSVNEPKIEPIDNNTSISTQMTIVVVPKRSPVNVNNLGESTINIVEITEDIFHPVKNFDYSKTGNSEDLLQHQIEDADYFDDFSADVDNYNSHSEFDNGIETPISLARVSDDDNFWDS